MAAVRGEDVEGKTAFLPKMTAKSAERKGGGPGRKAPQFETISIKRNEENYQKPLKL